MKSIYSLILMLGMSLCVNAKFHHAAHHHSFHHSTHHVTHYSSSSHHSIPHPTRTTPKTHYDNRRVWHNGMLLWLITRPKHHNDTYMIDNVQYKMCPYCKKTLIPLYSKSCGKCRKKSSHIR